MFFFDLVVGYESGLIVSFFGFMVVMLFVMGGGLYVMFGVFFELYKFWLIECMLFSVLVVLE